MVSIQSVSDLYKTASVNVCEKKRGFGATYVSRLLGHSIGNSLLEALEVLEDVSLVFEKHPGIKPENINYVKSV